MLWMLDQYDALTLCTGCRLCVGSLLYDQQSIPKCKPWVWVWICSMHSHCAAARASSKWFIHDIWCAGIKTPNCYSLSNSNTHLAVIGFVPRWPRSWPFMIVQTHTLNSKKEPRYEVRIRILIVKTLTWRNLDNKSTTHFGRNTRCKEHIAIIVTWRLSLYISYTC